MTTIDEIRRMLQALDKQLSLADEQWDSCRKSADEIIRVCLREAETAKEPEKTRLWLCALQASDLSKNCAISNLAFVGGLADATYSIPAELDRIGGIQNSETRGAWRKMLTGEPTETKPRWTSSELKRNLESERNTPPQKVSWKELIAISFHLLGNSLLVFIIDDLEPFLDGYLTDYGFREELLPGEYRLALDPIIIPDFYGKLPYPISDMQLVLDSLPYLGTAKSQYESAQKRFRMALGVLGMYFNVGVILTKLKEVGIDTRERVVLLLPDRALNQVPIHLLYTLFDGPLYEQFAGFTYSWDLISFKWRHYRRHIYYKRRFGQNKCVFFAAPDSQKGKYLSGAFGEQEALQRILGRDNVAIFGNKGPEQLRATRENFVLHHNDTEWLIFSGHGVDYEQYYLFPGRHGQASVIIPDFGMAFDDGMLSSMEILGRDCWNFSRSRLVLLNSCMLSKLAGAQTSHGIRTALYARGATSVLGSLWTVYDNLCPVFLEEFIQTSQQHINEGDSFVLARALNVTMKHLKIWTEKEYGLDMSMMYGGYMLDGLP